MSDTEMPVLSIGRNEPCPCGSGKKYKRCCGVSAAPKLSTPKASNPLAAAGAGGFDPSSLDPQWMMQFTQALQRLPKGQMQRLQAMMQKAMAGKDVSREAADFEHTLPLELQTLMHAAPMEQLAKMGQQGTEQGALPDASVEPAMTAEEAKAIVEAAAAAGKIDAGEAEELIKGADEAGGSKISKFWRNRKA